MPSARASGGFVLRRDPVEFGQLLLRRRPVRGADVLLDLLRRGGPGDDARHHGIAQQPAEREFEHGAAATGGKCFERADDAPVALADELLRVTLVFRQPRARRHLRAALVLAGEEAAGERTVGQDAQSKRLRQRKTLALDGAHQQAVLVLTGDEGREAVPARRVLRRDYLLWRKVRAADVADFTLPHEIVERA